MIINGSEYKGIFYNETNEKRYYEGGAHFKYKHLYIILSQLAKTQSETLPDSSHPKQLSSNNSMSSINNNNHSSQKKVSAIKLKNDRHLNSSVPLSKDKNYKKILLPPTIKSRNNSIINNRNHNISQPYSFNYKYNSSDPKNRNNSFIGIFSNKKNDNILNNTNNSSVLVPLINHHYNNCTNEQNNVSRNSRVPVSSLYCNLTNVHLNNNNTSFNNNMGLTLKKTERNNKRGLSGNILNVLYEKSSRRESKEEIGRNNILSLKKAITFKKNNGFNEINNKTINQILNINKKFDVLHNKYYRKALMYQKK